MSPPLVRSLRAALRVGAKVDGDVGGSYARGKIAEDLGDETFVVAYDGGHRETCHRGALCPSRNRCRHFTLVEESSRCHAQAGTSGRASR